MGVLFLDQSGSPGGAELCLLDIVRDYPGDATVGLFVDGPFRQQLEDCSIAVQVLAQNPLAVHKESSLGQSLRSFGDVISLVGATSQLAYRHQCIYANTPKALVVGAIASLISRRPLIYHLHDIISPEHFSHSNAQLLVTLANRIAVHIIANSHATKAAFVKAGGEANKVSVIYNGFCPQSYCVDSEIRSSLRAKLHLQDKFVIGHFSRLAPWKGQHILIEALGSCPENTVALLVGDALFGEHDYVESLHRHVAEHQLEGRVIFLGFRQNVAELMSACDLITHTSTAPEPFGRVIVEAMLCQRPVIAAAAGGAVELVSHGETGWLCPPGEARKLSELIHHSYYHPEQAKAVALAGHRHAAEHYSIETVNQAIQGLLQGILG